MYNLFIKFKIIINQINFIWLNFRNHSHLDHHFGHLKICFSLFLIIVIPNLIFLNFQYHLYLLNFDYFNYLFNLNFNFELNCLIQIFIYFEYLNFNYFIYHYLNN